MVKPLAFAACWRYAFNMKFMSKDFILLAFLVLGIAVTFKLYKSKQNYAISAAQTAIREQDAARKTHTSGPKVAAGADPYRNETTRVPQAPNTPPTAQATSHTQIVSQESKNHFFQTTALKLDLPENIPFQNLDMGIPNTEAIYSRANGMEMAVVARKGEATKNDIEAFLQSADTGIPNLDKRGLKFSPAQSMQPAQGSGMKSATLWNGTGPGNSEIHVAVFTRADGAGTYMFVVSGDSSSLESHGDDLEQIYKSIKAESGTK